MNFPERKYLPAESKNGTENEGTTGNVKQKMCGFCGILLSSTSTLRRHERNIHKIPKNVKGAATFECDICKTKFVRKFVLIHHLCREHGIKVETTQIPTEKDELYLHEKSIILSKENCPLKENLPDKYEYKVVYLDTKNYVMKFRFLVNSEEEVDGWIKQYCSENSIRMRILGGISRSKKKNVLHKVRYTCIHNTHPDKRLKSVPRKRHTNCPFKLFLSAIHKMNRIIVTVIVRGEHNHKKSAECLKYASPTPEVLAEFQRLFKEGHSPKRALEMYTIQLQHQYGKKFYVIKEDRTVMPNYQWVYHQYNRMLRKEFGKNYKELKKSIKEWKRIQKEQGTSSSIASKNVLYIALSQTEKSPDDTSYETTITDEGEVDLQLTEVVELDDTVTANIPSETTQYWNTRDISAKSEVVEFDDTVNVDVLTEASECIDIPAEASEYEDIPAELEIVDFDGSVSVIIETVEYRDDVPTNTTSEVSYFCYDNVERTENDLEQNSETGRNVYDDDDGTENFYKSLTMSINKLPKHLQSEAKARCLAVVTELMADNTDSFTAITTTM